MAELTRALIVNHGRGRNEAFGPALLDVAEAEACAEKLARYRRVPYARDLYDLAWFAGRHLGDDERRWAASDHRHREEIEAAISALRG